MSDGEILELFSVISRRLINYTRSKKQILALNALGLGLATLVIQRSPRQALLFACCRFVVRVVNVPVSMSGGHSLSGASDSLNHSNILALDISLALAVIACRIAILHMRSSQQEVSLIPGVDD